MAREAWTDERLGDLNEKVDAGFEDMRREFTAARSEMRQGLTAVRSKIREELTAVRSGIQEEVRGVRSEMTDIRAELGALDRTIHQFLFAIVGTIFLGFTGTIAALPSLV